MGPKHAGSIFSILKSHFTHVRKGILISKTDFLHIGKPILNFGNPFPACREMGFQFWKYTSRMSGSLHPVFRGLPDMQENLLRKIRRWRRWFGSVCILFGGRLLISRTSQLSNDPAILPRDTWGVEAVAVVVIAVSIIILIRSFVTNVVII